MTGPDRSLALAGLVALSVAGHWLVPPARRPAYLALVSLALVAAWRPFDALAAALAVVLVLLCARSLSDRAPRQRRLGAALVLLVGSLCVLKYGGAAAPLPGLDPESTAGLAGAGAVLLPLGFSFVVFRCVHVLVEVYRGSIGSLRAWDLAAYVFFFPAFLAGPLERFPRFVQQSRASAGLQADDVRAGLLRMLVGALRKVVVAPLLAQHVRLVLGAPHEHAPLAVLAAVYGTALWLYMDFAGYTDMALGLARLLGYRLVENFDRPFLAGNIAVFWRRWHISLYAFIRDYFFWPLFGTRPSRLLTAVGVVCTMLVFMLWHGAEPRWLVLGLYHGLALVLWSLLQDAKAGRPRLRRALSSAPGRALAWLLTFHFVACGFLLFFYDLAHARAIVGRLVSAAAGPAAW